jgi:hypothetical protein
LTEFSKPSIDGPSVPDIPPIDINPTGNVGNITNDLSSTVDPKYYKKYVPKSDFNFFLNLLKENSLIILLAILDGTWFAYRCSKTYVTVVKLLHGFPCVIDVDEEAEKIKEKTGKGVSVLVMLLSSETYLCLLYTTAAGTLFRSSVITYP